MSEKKTTKKALFVTAAALILGGGPVSTFGGAVSAYAAETKTGSSFEITSSGVVKSLNGNTENVGALAGILATNYIDSVNSGVKTTDSLINLSRQLVTGIVGMIPYGGSFVSPFLAMLWPSAGPSQIQVITEQVSSLIDEKIEIYDGSAIRKQFEALKDQVQAFENAVNNKPYNTPAGAQMTQANIESSNSSVALDLQGKFIDLLKACQKDGQKEAELPVFTAVATAHLIFMKFMEQNGENHSRIKMDSSILQHYFTNDMKKRAQEYRDYIFKTSRNGQQKIYQKMTSFPDGTYSTNSNEVYNALIDSQMKSIAAGGDGKRYKDAMEPYRNAANQLKEYVNVTEDSEAFKMVAESIIGSSEAVAPGDFADHDILLSVNGKNVLATNKGEIRADSTIVGGWEKLTLVRASNTDRDNIYALRAASNNKFVAFNTIGGKVVVDADSENDPRAKFKLISLGNGKYAIKPLNTNGNLVYANFHSNGPLSVNSREITDWSTFTISSYTGGPVKDKNGDYIFK
ncbi:insecticidal delta-endotoxin Cry8Ea1 family protein [Bacillus thuringiensis]|nr:insecticidal delta-endotoxin Cry8Ea1 family protein [Bacillus thuringiensis]